MKQPETFEEFSKDFKKSSGVPSSKLKALKLAYEAGQQSMRNAGIRCYYRIDTDEFGKGPFQDVFLDTPSFNNATLIPDPPENQK